MLGCERCVIYSRDLLCRYKRGSDVQEALERLLEGDHFSGDRHRFRAMTA